MLDDHDISDVAKLEVVDFVVANAGKMRELSLRMVLKVADIRKSMPDNWQAVVEVTCMRGSR
jgi:NADP-dependent 3-hydroxy acid dehydrogenase YdfG